VSPAQWSSLLGFAHRNRLQLVYGLNDLYGRPTKTSPETHLCAAGTHSRCPPRNTSNYEALLSWTARRRPVGWESVFAFELGNELNSCLNGLPGARTQAEDLNALGRYIERVWPSRAAGVGGRAFPGTIGPDTHSSAEFQAAGREWFADFAQSAGSSASALTFHEYSLGSGPSLDPTKLSASFLSPVALDKSGAGIVALKAALGASPSLPPLWAGETAAANNGGQSGITDTFIDGFWYLDQLGQHASLNVSVTLRQTLMASGGYPLVELVGGVGGTDLDGGTSAAVASDEAVKLPTPLPDYWLALLHKRLLGRAVLSANSTSDGVRVYAHCARGGGVALAFLNLDEAKAVSLELPRLLGDAAERVEYILTAGEPIQGALNPLQSKGVRLNGGAPLALVRSGSPPSAALPPLEGKHVPQTGARSRGGPQGGLVLVELPNASLGFLLWPSVKADACN
jgi:hypothetical protein